MDAKQKTTTDEPAVVRQPPDHGGQDFGELSRVAADLRNKFTEGHNDRPEKTLHLSPFAFYPLNFASWREFFLVPFFASFAPFCGYSFFAICYLLFAKRYGSSC